MCIQSVQVALQLQSHCLFKVRPVEVSQHVEQVPADLLHQGLKGVGELFAWRERKRRKQNQTGETGLGTGITMREACFLLELFYIINK